MAKEKVDFSALADYIPEGSLAPVLVYIYKHKIQLTLTKKRASILGDYRNATNQKNHRISINSDLNKYAFLITLLHEIAHLLTFEKHGNNVQAHGKQWKGEFSNILKEFIEKKYFPTDVEKALAKSINNPAASSCADEPLLRTLKNYDKKKEGVVMIEQLLMGDVFKIRGEKIFIMGEKIRKRYKCQELATKKWYLFSPVFEVMKITNK